MPMRARLAGLSIAASALLAACADNTPTTTTGTDSPATDLTCSIPRSMIFDGGPGKDGIPALVDPPLVLSGDPAISFMRDDDRVIGLEVNGDYVAVSLNVGWWHEIVNLELGGLPLAITHCPLTGSSLAFDRATADGAAFGVSGLLFRNNLVMYDRNRPESLWPQMARAARCGVRDGAALIMVPVIEMTWEGWRTLHPDTRVVSPRQPAGFTRDYRLYPYGSYDRVGNEQLLFPMDHIDRRRPLKERVLGIPDGDGGFAFPYGALDQVGSRAAIHHDNDGDPFVVLWDRSRQSAAAFRPRAAGQELTFRTEADAIVDVETGSAWEVDGHASAGPLRGEKLEPVVEAYVAFWFAWAAFHRNTSLWTGEGS